MNQYSRLFEDLDPKDAQGILLRTIDSFGERVTLATSFQLGGAVLLDIIHKLKKPIHVFSIDTGRLPPETREYSALVLKKYGVEAEWIYPQQDAIKTLEQEKGPNAFKESIAKRKACCGIRKVEPLTRALEPYDAWITGRRMDQSKIRRELKLIAEDPVHPGKLKINPLAYWTRNDLWQYVKNNNVPYNRLYDEGYLSIGCECCTRPGLEGEDERAGRWWWESTEHKECGLHLNSDTEI